VRAWNQGSHILHTMTMDGRPECRSGPKTAETELAAADGMFVFGPLEPGDREALVVLSTAAVACLSLVDRRQHRGALAVWSAALLLVTLPLADFQPRANWQHVAWIPFESPPFKWSDVIANVILYVPFGYAATRTWASSGVWRAAAAAALLSTFAELSQLFSVTRIPSTTDIVCNVTGAALGVLIAQLASERRWALAIPLPLRDSHALPSASARA